MKKKLSIKKIIISEDQKHLEVAEISANHQNSIKKTFSLLEKLQRQMLKQLNFKRLT